MTKLSKKAVKSLESKIINQASMTICGRLGLNLFREVTEYLSSIDVTRILEFNKNPALFNVIAPSLSNSEIALIIKINKNMKTISLAKHNLQDKEAMEIAKAMKDNDSLKFIDLKNNNISDEGAKYLAMALEKGNSAIPFEWPIHSYNKIFPDGDYDPAEFMNEEELRTRSYECYEEIWKSKRSSSAIIYIELAYNNITSVGAKDLSIAMQSSIVKYLGLSHNKIGYAISQSSFKSLENLSFYFSSMLKVSKYIEEIDLSYNNIDDRQALDIADGIQFNRSLLCLNLDCNDIHDYGAHVLAAACAANDWLRTLYLSENPIGIKGATELLSTLKNKDSGLQYVYLTLGKFASEAEISIFTEIQQISESNESRNKELAANAPQNFKKFYAYLNKIIEISTTELMQGDKVKIYIDAAQKIFKLQLALLEIAVEENIIAPPGKVAILKALFGNIGATISSENKPSPVKDFTPKNLPTKQIKILKSLFEIMELEDINLRKLSEGHLKIKNITGSNDIHQKIVDIHKSAQSIIIEEGYLEDWGERNLNGGLKYLEWTE